MRGRQTPPRRRLGARVLATVSALVAAGLLLPALAAGQTVVEEAPAAEVVVGQPAPEVVAEEPTAEVAEPAPAESPAPVGEEPVEEPAPPPAAEPVPGELGPDLSAAPTPEGEVAPPTTPDPAVPAAPAQPTVSEPVPHEAIVIAADAPRVQLGAATSIAAAPPAAVPAPVAVVAPAEALPTPAPVPAVAEVTPPPETKSADALDVLSTPLFASASDDAAEPPAQVASLATAAPEIGDPTTTLTTTIRAPVSAAPPGSSLLAVLAGYSLPGVGGMPATSLMFLVIVGLVVTLSFGARPGLTERLFTGGLVSASEGHRLAVARPG